jgi:hypothetical protein
MVHPAFLRDKQVYKDYSEAGRAGELVSEGYEVVRPPFFICEVRDFLNRETGISLFTLSHILSAW